MRWLTLTFVLGFILLPTIALAVQESGGSTNVSLSIEVATSSGGGGGASEDIEGCTDPAAINYVATANKDDGSCLYPVPPVTNFIAAPNAAKTQINLSWLNPIYPQLAAVRIVRGTGVLPVSPTDGLVVYDGTGQAVTDYSVELNKNYYYVAFVRAIDGRYSTGVLALASTLSGDDDDDDDDPGEQPPGGSGGGNGPFDWPQAPDVDPIFRQITLGDFKFAQPGESIKIFRNRDAINIRGEKSLTVWIETDLFPEVLKTIVVTLRDPRDNNKTFSFLLQADHSLTRYTGTIGPLVNNGVYPISIHVLNFHDQSLLRLDGRLVVTGEGMAGAIVSSVAKNTGLPIVITAGVVAGAAQIIVVTTRIASLYDLYLLLLRWFGTLLGWLGLRRKHQPWGVVYDSVTKRPIDPAYLVVRQNGQEVATAITDIDGRYGFFLPPGQYDIEAGKTHYTFPSQKMAGRSRDIIYDNLYFGEEFETRSDEVVTRNIPLDPVGFDWNEFVKSQTDFFRITSRRELLKTRIINIIYTIGFVSTLIAVLFTPSLLNLSLLALYVAIYLLQIWWHYHHKIITIRRASGEPIPFAVVTVYMPGLDQRIKSVVTDKLGRFYLLVPPGEYYLTIDEKQADEQYRSIYRSEPMNLKRGVLSEDLLVPAIS